jgi:hypothetical protein
MARHQRFRNLIQVQFEGMDEPEDCRYKDRKFGQLDKEKDYGPMPL